MTELPNIVRERMKAAAAGLHPDSDLLTAFAERALSERERIPVLDHLVRCAECRDVIALATPPTQSAIGKDTVRISKAPLVGWPILRWGALAACVVIVGTAVLLQHSFKASVPVPVSVDRAALSQEEPLGQVATFNDSDQQAETQKAETLKGETKSDQLSTAKGRATRGEAILPKRPINLPSTPGSSGATTVKQYGGIAKQRLDLRPGAFAPAPPATTRPADARSLPLEERNSADLVSSSAPGAANETVQVEAMTAPVTEQTEKDEAVGKAKSPAPAQLVGGVAGASAYAQNKAAVSAEERGNLREEVFRFRADVSRWTISSDGQLQRSLDSGKTWQPVNVAEKATFRALSANGPDLWVGGARGLLYHSSDAGGHWTRVSPTVNGTTLTSDIAAIEFTDPRRGKITTAAGEAWITSDAGQIWQKQP
jgi:Photosynthesis system II assembly factor YCF48/Putative zinc-finger